MSPDHQIKVVKQHCVQAINYLQVFLSKGLPEQDAFVVKKAIRELVLAKDVGSPQRQSISKIAEEAKANAEVGGFDKK